MPDPIPPSGRSSGLPARLSRRVLHAAVAGLGRIVLAERFRAPAGLAALRLPTDGLRGRDMGAGETFRVYLVCAANGRWRRITLHAASAERRAILNLSFAAFDNPEGAMFDLLVTRRREPGEMRPGLVQTGLLRLDLGWQAPIVLGCNAEMPGFGTLPAPDGPREQMRLVDPPGA